MLAVLIFAVTKHFFMKTYSAGNQTVMQNRTVSVSAAVAVQSPCLSSVSSEHSWNSNSAVFLGNSWEDPKALLAAKFIPARETMCWVFSLAFYWEHIKCFMLCVFEHRIISPARTKKTEKQIYVLAATASTDEYSMMPMTAWHWHYSSQNGVL